MTITQNRRPSLFAVLSRRIRNSSRAIFARGDFFALSVAFMLMLLPVLGLRDAVQITDDGLYGWKVSLSQLIPIAFLSVGFGFLLARSHYSETLSLLISFVYAVGSVIVIQLWSAPGSLLEKGQAVVIRLFNALNNQQATAASLGLDPFLLIIMLSILLWFLGHNAGWHLFRLDRVWRAILPPGIVLVMNNVYNTQVTRLDAYLAIYVFLALLMLIRSHVEAREFDWYTNRVAFKGTIRNWFFRGGAVLGAVLLIAAWLTPVGSVQESAKRFQEFMNSNGMVRLMDMLNRIFGSLEGQGLATADYYGSDRLTLGGPISLGDRIIMVVQAPTPLPSQRYYWKSRVFDTYSANQWSAERSTLLKSTGNTLTLAYPNVDPATRREMTQRIRVAIGGSRLVYAAPQPIDIGLPVSVETNELAQGVYDPVVIRPLTVLKEGDTYSVTSSIVNLPASQLRQLPADYPAWVTRTNLQIPPEISADVRNLAVQIINQAGAQNNYDRAKAIEQWLRNNITYDETPEPPPANQEMVQWVLFRSRQGYCTYYASAMIMMLRSIGIPSRMAAGFSQGFYDPQQGSYVVRERDAHTWVEVYFPTIGWVEFEPTSAQETLERPDQLESQASPTPFPSPSPTVTPSPTPTATPTLEPSATSAVNPPIEATKPLDVVTQTATIPPTVQPTLTPTPSPTPPPTNPLSFLEIPPATQNVLFNLLWIALLIAVISIVLVTLVWWIDYRGLDRLGPIGRAYARTQIYGRWTGVPLSEANTPLERGRKLARSVPEGSRPIMDITDNYITERYAPPNQVNRQDELDSDAAWRKARRAFIWNKFRRGRKQQSADKADNTPKAVD